MNVPDFPGNKFPWRSKPEGFKDAWRHIWQIFESEGTNDFATWALCYSVNHTLSGYWPGDEFVDWVGFSAYNNPHWKWGYRDLEGMISTPYRHFAEKNKPYILEELGMRNPTPNWLRKSYATIPKFENIEASLYWDSKNIRAGDDYRLRDQGYEALKEILKDPYFVGAKT
jgi:beta-mannanase